MNKIPDKALRIMQLLSSPFMAPSGRMVGPARDVLIVGGFVRDSILGIDSKDVDIEVFGLDIDIIRHALESHGFQVDAVGKAFGVLKVDNEIDVSIPRRENKIGVGHRAFQILTDFNMSVEEAAARRDFTINSMAMRMDGTIIDPFNGQKDIQLPVLRATSAAFQEDALRVLRAMQFAARFGGSIADQATMKMARAMRNEFQSLPKERIWEEWKKFALKGKSAFFGFLVLSESDWLDLFPQLNAMVGVPQDSQWHPEGWSASGLSEFEISSINLRLASLTQPNRINLGFTLRQLFESALARFTARPHTSSALCTKSTEIGIPGNSILTAPLTWTLGFESAAFPTPTFITKAEGFVGNISTLTINAPKVIRIMLEIPQAGMLSIMRSAVNDFEIVKAVIQPISIFMMNMLFGSQFSTKMKLHEQTMQTDGTIFTGPTNVDVTRMIVDTASNTIDGNIIVSFDLTFKGNVEFLHTDFLSVDKNNPSLFYTKVAYGDVFTHTILVVQEAIDIANREQLDDNDRMVLFFAALCHDMGKPATTKFQDGRWRAKGHCEDGVADAKAFLASIGAPLWLIEQVAPLVREHLVHAAGMPTDRAVRRLAQRLAPSSIRMLSLLIEADHSGRSPLPRGNPFVAWMDAANKLNLSSSKPVPILKGRDLIGLGVSPGPVMGQLLAQAFQAQLDGEFLDLDSAIGWMKDLISRSCA